MRHGSNFTNEIQQQMASQLSGLEYLIRLSTASTKLWMIHNNYK